MIMVQAQALPPLKPDRFWRLTRRIIPNSALVMPSMTPKSVINNISSNRTNAPAVNFPVGDASLFNDPIFVAKLQNYILSMMDGMN